ncbi:hypothetical protein CHL78_017960 [Romboutsia weinsteinii]|uniref:Uncharacterized protein n=1 Tax=Romboutsia weinsteinii TaxID=2020949 RepID=A0A371IYB9_9FIRM|nr:hypothetical protein [Romboutsia weinsteinii]RDY25483.1 hypothetical protein CHL78_017960 [Romboutsia weinsteinii]
MIFIKNKKNIFIVIVFLGIAFLGLQNLNSGKRKIANIEYYTIANDLSLPHEILTLDSGRIYEYDDSKYISIDRNSLSDIISMTDENDKSKFVDLFKGKKCVVISSNEISMPFRTDDKEIYTKIKYQFKSIFRPDENGNYEKKCSPGTGKIYDDGIFEMIFRLENTEMLFLRGEFNKSEMNTIKYIYDKLYEEKNR